jgi:protocatechuate 3,4-dioxygenase beta subunit
MSSDDDRTIGRVLARREMLALFGTSASVAVVAAYAPGRLTSRWRGALAPATAAEPCVVRPEQTEGPYFVDERLNRSDIRSDPGTGAAKVGTPLALAFVVQRIDGATCVPLADAVVDVWHCDAAGVYSDVADSGFTTVGQKFLRGYQRTDASGSARFVTIFPGWYPGRTVHIHFKVRTDPDAASGFEFTSQLYFDDALTDVVHAQQPYAATGERTVRNAGDGIYRSGGDQLLLAAADDGAGGYTASFDIALEVGDSTLPGETCTGISACLTNLGTALPDPATASSRKARRVARRLARLGSSVAAVLERADGAGARRQARLYAKARAKLQRLLTVARAADDKGTLGVALAPIASAVSALTDQL